VTSAVSPPTDSSTSRPDRSESRLFAETYESVLEYHIKETRADVITLAALAELPLLDPSFSVAREGDTVRLRRDGRSWRFHAPPPFDSEGWGRLTSMAFDAARNASPILASWDHEWLEESVIDRALATLDRFSHYSRPELAREWRAARDGYGGIGIVLDGVTGTRIASVMADSPAAAAGIRINDQIIALDGVPSSSMTPQDLRERLRGPASSVVMVGIQRAGIEKSLNLSIQRAHLVPPTVSLKEDGDIAIFKITSFNQDTGESLAELLKQAHREMGDRLKGIVLDLRDNPGGLLDQSIEVSSQFLDGGTIVTTIGRNPESFQYFAAPNDHRAERLPMAVLVNGGSASASEIVAAALQDSDRAVVIGTSSYGKGTVQTVLRTSNDGELTITWARLVTPRGYFLHHHGVVPTICTADIAKGANVTAILAKSPAPDLTKPRDLLDESGWTALRDACPAEREDRSLDIKLAQRLLDNRMLYSRILHDEPVNLAHNYQAAVR
jgi:carboxyl-terminal processing protease